MKMIFGAPQVEGGRYGTWSHASLLRLIYLLLIHDGRKKAKDTLFKSLLQVVKDYYHKTIKCSDVDHSALRRFRI